MSGQAGGSPGGLRPTVELLYFDGCPHWETAAERLQRLAADLAFDLRRRVVSTPEEEAAATAFMGSPTILVDGRDPFAGPADRPGMSCRLFATPDGLAGSPTLDQLRAALGG